MHSNTEKFFRAYITEVESFLRMGTKNKTIKILFFNVGGFNNFYYTNGIMNYVGRFLERLRKVALKENQNSKVKIQKGLPLTEYPCVLCEALVFFVVKYI